MKMTRPRFLTIAGINTGVLASSVALGPLGSMVVLLGLVLAAFTLFSEIGFVVLITAISHVNDDFGYGFELIRALKWAAVGLALVVTTWQFSVRSDWGTIRIEFVEKYFAIFFLWGCVCVLFSDSMMMSLKEFVRLLSYYLIYFITKATVRNKKHLYIMLSLFTVVVFASTTYSLGDLLQSGYFRVRGFMNNSGAYAQVLGYMIPFVVAAAVMARRRMLRYFLVFVSSTGVLALFLAWSRASIIAAVVQYIVFLVIEKKKRLLAWSGAVALVAMVVVMTSPAFWDLFYTVGRLEAGSTHRFVLWEKGVNAFLESPIVGHGFRIPTYEVLDRVYWNNMVTATLFEDTSQAFNVHNEFLDAALTTGIPGLLIFIGFLYYLIRHGIRDCRREEGTRRRILFTAMLSINVSLVVVCLFANGPHLTVGSMANYFWITLGLVHAVKEHDIKV